MRVHPGRRRSIEITEEVLGPMMSALAITIGEALGRVLSQLERVDDDGQMPEFIDLHIVPMETAQADGTTDGEAVK